MRPKRSDFIDSPESKLVQLRIERFLIDPWFDALVVPMAYAKGSRKALKEAGFHPRKEVWNCDGYVQDCLAVTFAAKASERKDGLERALTAIFGPPGARTSLMTLGGTRLVRATTLPVVVPMRARMVVTNDYAPGIIEKSKRWDEASASFEAVLHHFCQVTGYQVQLVPATRSSCVEPLKIREPLSLRIVLDSAPAGEAVAIRMRTVLGLPIAKDGMEVHGCDWTRGRGKALVDDEGVPYVQEVGSTWYVLPPLVEHFELKRTTVLFLRILQHAWNELGASRPKKERQFTPDENRDRIISSLVAFRASYPDIVRVIMKDTQIAVVNAQRELAQHYANLQIHGQVLTALEIAGSEREWRRSAEAAVAELAADPMVKALEYRDDGMQVRLKELRMKCEGRTYRLGALTVRVTNRCAISVWAEKPLHYGNVIHPHIMFGGHPCFGSAGGAILKAAGEMRVAETVRYVVRWLQQGYSPGHTLHPVSQWPMVGESREQYVLRMARSAGTGVPTVRDTFFDFGLEEALVEPTPVEPLSADADPPVAGNGAPPPETETETITEKEETHAAPAELHESGQAL